MYIRMFILISKDLVLFFNEVAPPFEVDPPVLCMAAAQRNPAQNSSSSNINFSLVICLKNRISIHSDDLFFFEILFLLLRS